MQDIAFAKVSVQCYNSSMKPDPDRHVVSVIVLVIPWYGTKGACSYAPFSDFIGLFLEFTLAMLSKIQKMHWPINVFILPAHGTDKLTTKWRRREFW